MTQIIKKCKPVISVYDTNGAKLVAGKDYESNISYTYIDENGETVEITKDSIVPSGTRVTATITGKGNYTGKKSTLFKYVCADIKNAKISGADKIYTGKAVTIDGNDIKPVKLDGIELTDEDYSIDQGSYVSNQSCGTAKVTIRGLGIYGGSKVVTFKILKKAYK